MNQHVKTERLIKTRFRIISPGTRGAVESEVMWPREPGLSAIQSVVEPLIGGCLEHVSVMADFDRGTNYVYSDMFVHETGVIDGLARNEEATTIYRRNWLLRYPSCQPETLAAIAGVAILFNRRVWF